MRKEKQEFWLILSLLAFVLVLALSVKAFAQSWPDPRGDMVAVPSNFVGPGGVVSGPLLLPDGACGTAPSLAFASEPNLGFYRQGTDHLAICTNSGEQAFNFFKSGGNFILTMNGQGQFQSSGTARFRLGASVGQLQFMSGAASFTTIIDGATDEVLRLSNAAGTKKAGFRVSNSNTILADNQDSTALAAFSALSVKSAYNHGYGFTNAGYPTYSDYDTLKFDTTRSAIYLANGGNNGLSGTAQLAWYGSGVGSSAFDTGLKRDSAGIVGATSGSSGIGSFMAASYRLDGASGQGIYWGDGTPEGSLTAPMGSIYLNIAGGAGTTLYVKETGSGDTGWIGK